MNIQSNIQLMGQSSEPRSAARRWQPGVAGALLTLACAMPAFAGVAVVVSAKSPVAGMTPEQISQVYTGKTATLPGGVPAVLIDQSEGSPLRDQFYAKVTNKQPVQIKALWSRLVFSGAAQMPKAVNSDADVKKALNDAPGAIGYIDKAAVDGSVKVLYSVD